MSGQYIDFQAIRQTILGHQPQWASYGNVAEGKNGNADVVLDDGNGGPPPYGPLVMVTLQPSGVSLPCRVASAVAGDGEADFYPFVAGDEVLVILPDGHERGGGVIVARLNQEQDAFPTTVAGQKTTNNSFGFRRMRAPFVTEAAAGYVIRNATTGSQIGIDGTGQVIINDGDRGHIVIGSEGIGFSTGDGGAVMQIYPGSKEAMIVADTTSMRLAAGASKFISQGTIEFHTAGGLASGHAVTAEQVVALTINLIAQLAIMKCFNENSPLGYSTVDPAKYPGPTPQTAQAKLASIVGPILTAMAGAAPVGPGPGGAFFEFQSIFGPGGAIRAASANPLAAVDVTGAIPGFGRPGFRL